MSMAVNIGFCFECKKFYQDDERANTTCPRGHPLLHATKCESCGQVLYFQDIDDHCGPDDEKHIICGKCAGRMAI